MMVMMITKVTLTDIERERAIRSFEYFITKSWSIVEPARYIPNWHIGLICEYLQAVTSGEVQNLIINIPFRCMKSLITCVFWPVWSWSVDPTSQWLFASYAERLSVRDAVRSRRIIQSYWYQERFGEVFTLQHDQNVKSRYENDRGGYRISIGVGGSATGEGGDFIVIDDPIKEHDAYSDVARDAVNDWYDGTISTRANDPQNSRKVVIMQRLHANDLTGHLLDKQDEGGYQWEHVCLPMRYEPARYISSIGLDDRRTKPGELLWSNRFTSKIVETLEAALGRDKSNAQLQQNPLPEGGVIFLSEWFDKTDSDGQPVNRYNTRTRARALATMARYLVIDTAFKDQETNDFTAIIAVEITRDYRMKIVSVEKKRLQFPQLAQEIIDQAGRWNSDGLLRGIVIEDKGSGTSILQTLNVGADTALASILVEFNPGKASKTARARRASLWCERGCVLLPDPTIRGGARLEWLFDFEENLYAFPGIKFDDDIDAFVMGILYLEHFLARGWKLRTGLVESVDGAIARERASRRNGREQDTRIAKARARRKKRERKRIVAV